MTRKQVATALTVVGEQAVAAYVRVSTDEQARTGLGMEAQRKRCAAMATVKDWPDPVFYLDEGISGTKGPKKRPGLARLLADVKAGTYQAVIIHSLDRLGRKTSLVLELVDELNAAGVSLVSCKEQLDTTTPQGQFVLTMFAALAQLEAGLIAERTKAALAAKRARDGVAGGKLPHGYHRLPDGGVGVERSAARAVRRIFELHRTGDSLRSIAQALQAEGFRPPRGGDTWRHTAVDTILKNASVYRGGEQANSGLHWPTILQAEDVALAVSA